MCDLQRYPKTHATRIYGDWGFTQRSLLGAGGSVTHTECTSSPLSLPTRLIWTVIYPLECFSHLTRAGRHKEERKEGREGRRKK